MLTFKYTQSSYNLDQSITHTTHTHTIHECKNLCSARYKIILIKVIDLFQILKVKFNSIGAPQ